MIQRVQSIWLLLASLTLFTLLLLPIVSKTMNGTEFWILVSGLYQHASTGTVEVESFLPLMISTIVIALIALANIFNYRNRTLQKRICNVVIILTIGLSFWISSGGTKNSRRISRCNLQYRGFTANSDIIFCFLAIRGIRKDEQLIKSADRLTLSN